MSVPCGIKKFPEPFFLSESPAELFPVRGEKGRGEIIPDFFKPCFSQDLSGVIKTLFLVFPIQEFLEIASSKRLIPQKVGPIRQVVNHALMLPLFPHALNSPIKYRNLTFGPAQVDMIARYWILSFLKRGRKRCGGGSVGAPRSSWALALGSGQGI